jgi:outer membrane protein
MRKRLILLTILGFLLGVMFLSPGFARSQRNNTKTTTKKIITKKKHSKPKTSIKRVTTKKQKKTTKKQTNKPKPLILTLKDAILLSIRYNPDLQNAELTRVTDKYAVVVAKNQFEPQYSIEGATFTREFSTASGISSHSSTGTLAPNIALENHYGTQLSLTSNNPWASGVYNPGLTLAVTQPLLKGFGKAVVDATLNTALYNEKNAKLNFKNTVMSKIASVINDYMQVVQSQKTLANDRETLHNYQVNVKNTQSQVNAGEKAKSEIVKAQAQVTKQQATIASDVNSLHSAHYQLLDDLGLKLDANIQLPKKIDFDGIIKILKNNKPLPDVKTSEQKALQGNINYQTIKIALKLAKIAIITAKDAQRWQLDVKASATRGNGSGSGNDANLNSLLNSRNHNEQVGLVLSIPIDDVDNKSELITAKIGLKQSQINLKEGEKVLRITADNDRFSIISSELSLKANKQSLKLQRQTVKDDRVKYTLGEITNFELLTEQQNSSDQANTTIGDQISYINSLVTFDQELGVLLDYWDIKLRY